MPRPLEARCVRCGRTGPAFPADPAWGRVKGPLCSRDWQKFAEARANDSYVDWNDAFGNASDEELEANLGDLTHSSARGASDA